MLHIIVYPDLQQICCGRVRQVSCTNMKIWNTFWKWLRIGLRTLYKPEKNSKPFLETVRYAKPFPEGVWEYWICTALKCHVHNTRLVLLYLDIPKGHLFYTARIVYLRYICSYFLCVEYTYMLAYMPGISPVQSNLLTWINRNTVTGMSQHMNHMQKAGTYVAHINDSGYVNPMLTCANIEFENTPLLQR